MQLASKRIGGETSSKLMWRTEIMCHVDTPQICNRLLKMFSDEVDSPALFGATNLPAFSWPSATAIALTPKELGTFRFIIFLNWPSCMTALVMGLEARRTLLFRTVFRAAQKNVKSCTQRSHLQCTTSCIGPTQEQCCIYLSSIYWPFNLLINHIYADIFFILHSCNT